MKGMSEHLSEAPERFPDETASFALAGPAGKLECEARAADPEVARNAIAVICHPLSTDGGSMRNKVVTMIERSLREAGVDTVIFSFGSYVTLRNAVSLGAEALISVAPPAAGRGWDFGPLDLPTCPWLVVMGDADEIVEPQAVYDWIDSLPEDRRPQLIRMEDTSHFFHRRLMDLRGAIKHAVKDWLPGPRPT
jgi:alpha/beta superfamily hydrolase